MLIVIIFVFPVRIFVGGKECPSKNSMDGKIVLITGGATGIGLETAKELTKRGTSIFSLRLRVD